MRGLFSRRCRRIKALSSAPAIALLLTTGLATPPAAHSQVGHTNAEMREVGGDPRGLPVQTFLEKSIGSLAREYLLENNLEKNMPHAQQRGLQVELFAPGDFGVVMRYRW